MTVGLEYNPCPIEPAGGYGVPCTVGTPLIWGVPWTIGTFPAFGILSTAKLPKSGTLIPSIAARLRLSSSSSSWLSKVVGVLLMNDC